MLLSSISTLLLAIVVAPFLQLAQASAAKQFSLNVDKDMSQCWIACHSITIRLVHGARHDPLGVDMVIGPNCRDEAYIQAIPSCLLARCGSAPDVAYAVESGIRWCEKAGVDVREALVLPENYTQVQAVEYFQSEAYLSGASLAYAPPTAVSVSVATMILALLGL